MDDLDKIFTEHNKIHDKVLKCRKKKCDIWQCKLVKKHKELADELKKMCRIHNTILKCPASELFY